MVSIEIYSIPSKQSWKQKKFLSDDTNCKLQMRITRIPFDGFKGSK